MGACYNWIRIDLNENRQIEFDDLISNPNSDQIVRGSDYSEVTFSDGLSIRVTESSVKKYQTHVLTANPGQLTICHSMDLSELEEKIKNSSVAQSIIDEIIKKLGLKDRSLDELVSESSFTVSDIEDLLSIGEMIASKYGQLEETQIAIFVDIIFSMIELDMISDLKLMTENFIKVDQFVVPTQSENTGKWVESRKENDFLDFLSQSKSLLSVSIYISLIQKNFPDIDKSDSLVGLLLDLNRVYSHLIQAKVTSCHHLSGLNEVAAYRARENNVIFNGGAEVGIYDLDSQLKFPYISLIVHEFIHTQQDDRSYIDWMHRVEAHGWLVTGLVTVLLARSSDDLNRIKKEISHSYNQKIAQRTEWLDEIEKIYGKKLREELEKGFEEYRYQMASIDHAENVVRNYKRSGSINSEELAASVQDIANKYRDFQAIDMIVGLIIAMADSSVKRRFSFLVFERKKVGSNYQVTSSKKDINKATISDIENSLNSFKLQFQWFFDRKDTTSINRNQETIKYLVISCILYLDYHRDDPNFNQVDFLENYLLPASRLYAKAQAPFKFSLGIK